MNYCEAVDDFYCSESTGIGTASESEAAVIASFGTACDHIGGAAVFDAVVEHGVNGLIVVSAAENDGDFADRFFCADAEDLRNGVYIFL